MSIPRVIKNPDCSGILARQPIHPAQERSEAHRPDGTWTPTVECIKEGNTVRYIDVRCGCGQVTRLVCEYATAGPDESSAR